MTAEDPIRPKGVTRYDLLGMNDEDFESMTARLIRLEFPTAFKPANTRDGGADMALPTQDGGYERCWQSKHFPRNIAWDQCKDSLTAAEKHWSPSHYTFCFPRNLTVGEQKTFDRHFRGPDATIDVDCWNGTEIEARLDGSPDGQRVAQTFFTDVELNHESVYRAIEAGGRIETTEDVADRLANLGSVLASKDAYFSYPAVTHETNTPRPPVTPAAVMSFGKSDGTITNRIDLVPRDSEAMDRYGPQFVLQPTESDQGRAAAARLEEALREGKAVEIGDGLDLTFTQLPPGFSDLVGRRLTGGTIRLTPSATPHVPIPPLDAHLHATTDAGTSSFDVLLEPTETAPDGWDGALQGHRAALTVTALFRKEDSGGRIRWNYSYARDDTPVREQLATLNFLRALSGTGELTITDRGTSGRPEQRMAIVGKPLSGQMHALITLFEYLRTVEKWTDVEFTLPETISGQEAIDIATVAAIVRNGGRSMTWHDLEATLPESGIDVLRRGQLIRIEQTVAARLLGSEISLGHTRVDIADYKLVSATPASEVGQVAIRIEPQDAGGGEVFEHLTKDPTPVRRPPPPPRRKHSKHKSKRRQR
jgi:hypothetical protein